MKTENVRLLVSYRITYDNKIKGAKQAVINNLVASPHTIDKYSVSTGFGSSSIKMIGAIHFPSKTTK